MATERMLVEIPGGDGRRVDVLVAGPEEGLPLVFHNGTPGGLVPFEPLISAAAVRGLRVVTLARPGYERSTAWPGRSVADAAGDVGPVLGALGADAFLTAGWSGGGPHALATAAGSAPVPGGGHHRRSRPAPGGRPRLDGGDGPGEHRGVRRS